MSKYGRPTFREIFLRAARRPEVYFYTSSLDKFLQASLVFTRNGLPLNHFRSRTEPYEEDYSGSKVQLLEKAVRQVTDTIGHSSLVFFEDTSVRIDALSTEKKDVPGLQVKEWFRTVSFDEVNAQLVASGNNRGCSVQSDIALYIPGLNRAVFFHGETRGSVAAAAPTFEQNWQHPWLSPNTFNGWIIPEGASKPLGAMSFEESWEFDFRIKSLSDLVDYVEEVTAALNLPPQSYYRRPERIQPTDSLPLFPPTAPVYVVVGSTCSGKTTFAEYAERQFGSQYIEASSVVRMLVRKHGITGANDFERAEELLRVYGKAIVAETILSDFDSVQDRAIVISGFRTIEELDTIRAARTNIKVVLIKASDKIRYARLLARNRDSNAKTFDAFKRIDSQQRTFGLLPIIEAFADYAIINEGTRDEYYDAIDGLVTGISRQTVLVEPRPLRRENSQLYRCLAVLAENRQPMTCAEIGAQSGATGDPIRHNNVNKVLKRAPGLVRRLDGKLVRYEILNAGIEYVHYANEGQS